MHDHNVAGLTLTDVVVLEKGSRKQQRNAHPSSTLKSRQIPWPNRPSPRPSLAHVFHLGDFLQRPRWHGEGEGAVTGVGGGESDKGGVDRGSYTCPWTWTCGPGPVDLYLLGLSGPDELTPHTHHTHAPSIPYPKSPNLGAFYWAW